MADVYRQVRSESWLSRLGDSIKSVLTGVLLVGAALPAMWCNEGRAVTTARSLEEGQGAVTDVPSEAVSPANEGRLVHLTGRADTAETLRDPDFGVTASAIQLVRTTEMYQWQEYEKSESKDKPGGGKETVKTYSYSKTWSEKAIDSKLFHQSWSYDNPGPVPFPSKRFVAGAVTLGAFTLSRALVDEMKEREALPVTREMATALPRSTGMRLVGNGYYRGLEPEAPRVGDVRVRWSVVRPQTVSVVAGQAGTSFTAYQTRAGDALLMLEAGTRSAESMFRAAAAVNRVLTWVLRAVLFVFVFLGVLLVFRPIAVLGSVVPLFGSLLEAGLGLFSLGLGAALALLTIATAWVFYRPLFALGLLVATAAALVWLRRKAARRR
jgi:hypothetical protein